MRLTRSARLPVLLAILLATALANSLRWTPTAATSPDSAAIVSWTDGDTLRIRTDNTTVIIRLIGIDTPESRYNPRADLQVRELGRDLQTILALGRAAKAAAVRLAPPGTTVRVEYDVQRLDRYGRTLAYLYLSDRRMINEELVRQGWAMVLTIPPNVRYADRFVRAQREARLNRRGLWAQP
jgi:micrococcal nuclease